MTPDTPGSIVELRFSSDPCFLPVVRGAAQGMASIAGLDEADAHRVILALDEALANVIKHGYGNRHDQPIEVRFRPVADDDGRAGIYIEVRDRGKQVEPSKIRGRDLDDVRPGGLGVHIIQSVMDEYQYSCSLDGGMLLKMLKYSTPRKSVGPGGTEVASGPTRS